MCAMVTRALHQDPSSRARLVDLYEEVRPLHPPPHHSHPLSSPSTVCALTQIAPPIKPLYTPPFNALFRPQFDPHGAPI